MKRIFPLRQFEEGFGMRLPLYANLRSLEKTYSGGVEHKKVGWLDLLDIKDDELFTLLMILYS